MLKKITIITLIIFLHISVLSQFNAAGLEGKRITVEAGVGFSFFPKYFYTNNISDEIRDEGEIGLAKPTHRFNYRVGYVLTNKIQVQALFSHTKTKYGSISYGLDYVQKMNGDSHFHYHSFNNIKITGGGIKVSYYLHDFIAPVGGSIGLSFKKNFIKVKNHTFTDFKNIYDDWNGYDYWEKTVDSSEYNMKVNVLSFHYDNMFFVSSKLPLYIKYGIKMSLPFGAIGTRDGVEFDIKNRKGREQGYSNTVSEEQYGDSSSDYSGSYRIFKKYTNSHDIFEFNFSLGIVL